MSKQVPWNKIILEKFIELAALNEEETKIIQTRVAGWTITKQAIEFGMSESKVNKIIARLKVKYDNVQALDPTLPPRKFSAEETYQKSN